MRLLATLCNNPQEAILVAIGDGAVECAVRKGDLAGLSVKGATGITKTESGYAVSLQTDLAYIALIDERLRVVRLVEIPEAADLHGIVQFEEGFLVASTGTNQVIRLNKDFERVSSFWSPNDSLIDLDHINDLTVGEGRVLTCFFGSKYPDSMRAGKVVDLVTNAVIVSGLREPHSICMLDESTFVLESISGDLIESRVGFHPERVCGINGYARGLHVGRSTILIGRSGYRSDSRSTLGDSRRRPFDPSGDLNHDPCGIFMIDRAASEAKFIDLTNHGSEVYQILSL
jgi:hypothetical protein